MPFGAAGKIEEGEIRLFFWDHMSVDAQGQLRVRMAELRRNPGHALAGCEGEAREGVARIVKSKRTNTLALSLPS